MLSLSELLGLVFYNTALFSLDKNVEWIHHLPSKIEWESKRVSILTYPILSKREVVHFICDNVTFVGITKREMRDLFVRCINRYLFRD